MSTVSSGGVPTPQDPDVTPAATPEQWADHFSRALDDTEARLLLVAALRSHLTAAANTDVQDACVAGLDLLRRWRKAQIVGGFEADILLHDFRPIRPYAESIGRILGEYLAREASR